MILSSQANSKRVFQPALEEQEKSGQPPSLKSYVDLKPLTASTQVSQILSRTTQFQLLQAALKPVYLEF